MSGGNVEFLADNITEQHCGDLVSGLEQSNDHDVHLHANRRTMCHDDDFNNHGESASDTNIQCGESDLSGSYVECPADNITKQHFRNLESSLEQPSNDDVYLHANRWTMCHDNDLNDYGQSASHADLCGCESDLSGNNAECLADFLIEWNKRIMVAGLEQPSNHDVHVHSYRRTMFHDNDFNDHGQSASHTDLCSCESDLSRSYVECPADHFTE